MRELRDELDHSADLQTVKSLTRSVSMIVNAAGIASPNSNANASLLGANALLPAMIARACHQNEMDAFIHISSAAVQGDGLLDETPSYRPFSPYSFSKALGELAAREEFNRTIIFRPTSVHGWNRKHTQLLIKLAERNLLPVARPGTGDTPQVLVQNVAQAVSYLLRYNKLAPSIVLSPWEGFSTASFVELLSGGRRPIHMPPTIPNLLISGLKGFEPNLVTAVALRRRITLLCFGQQQRKGWLDEQGWVPPHGREDWIDMVIRAKRS